MSVNKLLVAIAFLLFALAALGVSVPYVAVVPAGLACWVLASLV